MPNVLIAPRRYIQGRNLIPHIGSYLRPIGQKPLFLWDHRVRTIIAPLVQHETFLDVEFRGQCTKTEAQRVAALAQQHNADIIVAFGGGKTLDTAKAAAAFALTKCVTVPTIASNDSPTSSYTVWYDDDGNCLGFESWGVNPDLVLVDTQIIAHAPVRSLVAGMGDALATWFEADACHKTRSLSLAGSGGTATMAALTLARLCYDTLMTHGIEAKRAVEQHLVTPAVEKIIEANVLLSGLGFESCGCASAHMIANCFPSFPECHGLMHGEEVAFGLLAQLCLDEDTNPAELYRVVDFEIAIGLPVTFAELGLANVTRDRLQKIGDICVAKGSLCENHPFPVTRDSLVDALFAADALGRARKQSLSSPTVPHSLLAKSM